MVGGKSRILLTNQPFANVCGRNHPIRAPKIVDLDRKIMFQTAANHLVVCFCTYTRNSSKLTLQATHAGGIYKTKRPRNVSQACTQ